MAELRLDDRSVVVALFLLAVEFSWTTMVRMSPTLTPRLSQNIGREISSRHNESACPMTGDDASRAVAMISFETRDFGDFIGRWRWFGHSLLCHSSCAGKPGCGRVQFGRASHPQALRLSS